MTKYERSPTGWWQDSKGRAQPPGSYLDHSLRVTASSAGGAENQASIGWLRRFRAARDLRLRPPDDGGALNR